MRIESLRAMLHGYPIAVVATALVFWVRWLLDPWLNEECPFSLFYLSVLLTAWIGGTGPAMLAIALGTFFAAFIFIRPQSSLYIGSVSEIVQLSIYVFVNCVATLLFERVKRQHHLAEQRSRDNELLSNSLREADDKKNEFLALLAHELRNPLAPMRSGLAILEREADCTGPVRRVLRVFARQTNNLTRITDDLLDISRFSRGMVELQIEKFDVREAIDDAIEMTADQINDFAHVFQRLIPPEPVWVNGDRLRLAQMVANLLSNASKYTPPGGRIVLELEGGPGDATISVRDNGIGFPPEQAANLLQPFMQIDASRTRDYGGLGLGLTIVSRLAALHGGQLSASSRGPGLGSCFALEVPSLDCEGGSGAAVPDVQDAEAADIAPAASCEEVNHVRRLLLAEDNPDAAELLSELLQSEGFEVSLARDGIGAMQLATSTAPEVCILDIGLPGLDGYEVARRIRRLPHMKDARLIALTGWGSPKDRELSEQAGFDLHLVKPIDYHVLLKHLQSNASMCEVG